MRQEMRDSELLRLIAAVKNHTEKGKSFAELRIPLEAVLGVSLEKYVEAVEEKEDGGGGQKTVDGVPFRGDAHKELASIIKDAMQDDSEMSK